MLRVLILEDEEYTLKFLNKLVSAHPLVGDIIGTSKGSEAIKLARQLPDIALLDIELAPADELNGIQVARNISIISPATQFVFISGYAQYAMDSFAVHPYDYVLKPINKEKVLNLISRLAIDADNIMLNKKEKRLIIKTADGVMFMNYDDIFFVEKFGRKAFIHNKNGIFETYCAINELEEYLPQQFLRVHKSFIINIDNICQIRDTGNQSYEVSFQGYKQVALISRNKFREHQDIFSPSF